MVPWTHSTTDQEALLECFADEGLEFLGCASAAEGRTSPEAALHQKAYRAWLQEGKNGSMDFLGRHEAGKYDPEVSLPGTRSVLVAGMRYQQPRPVPPSGHGLVARYAWGRDYHKVFKTRLDRVRARLETRWPGEQWRTFTDTAPLDERYWAQAAGAAFTARNTLSIRHGLGSWFFLGEILTTKDLAPSPRPSGAQGTCPSGCRRCVAVCPTGALDGAGGLDARRCLAYLTIEHRGPIEDSLKPLIGSWLFGCDLCQEVCPFNLGVGSTKEPEFLAWKAGPDLDPADLLGLDGPGFTARFGGSPVHRTGRDGLVRNACLVAGNLGRTDLKADLVRLSSDADAGVADAAAWALTQLAQGERQ